MLIFWPSSSQAVPHTCSLPLIARAFVALREGIEKAMAETLNNNKRRMVMLDVICCRSYIYITKREKYEGLLKKFGTGGQ
jgi:hypothetical protein